MVSSHRVRQSIVVGCLFLFVSVGALGFMAMERLRLMGEIIPDSEWHRIVTIVPRIATAIVFTNTCSEAQSVGYATIALTRTPPSVVERFQGGGKMLIKQGTLSVVLFVPRSRLEEARSLRICFPGEMPVETLSLPAEARMLWVSPVPWYKIGTLGRHAFADMAATIAMKKAYLGKGAQDALVCTNESIWAVIVCHDGSSGTVRVGSQDGRIEQLATFHNNDTDSSTTSTLALVARIFMGFRYTMCYPPSNEKILSLLDSAGITNIVQPHAPECDYEVRLIRTAE